MIRSLIVFVLCCFHCCFCFAVDFDVIVVGTSPIALLEALYRYYTGNRVLILEKAPVCGGSWKSVTACGIPYADLGCHQLGGDPLMSHFLSDYVGCQVVSMDHPDQPFLNYASSPNGFYLSRGCYEMVHNIEEMIEKTDIVLLLNHPIESVCVDPIMPQAFVRTNGKLYSTTKILVTPYSEIRIENHPNVPLSSQNLSKGKYYHLYMLVQDPTPSRFTYHSGFGGGEGIARMMNLSAFMGMQNTGEQLIVIQLYNEQNLSAAQKYVDYLKKHNLLDPSATLLQTQSYIYEQPHYNQSLVTQVPNGTQVFELLSTSNIHLMSNYVSKWMQVIPKK